MKASKQTKFKKGDKVVVVRNTTGFGEDGYLGHSFVINHFSRNNPVTTAYPEGAEMGGYLDDLELEVVANSPLFEALK